MKYQHRTDDWNPHMLNSVWLSATKPLTLTISTIVPVPPPSFPLPALRVLSRIFLLIYVPSRPAQRCRVFSLSHNGFEPFCAYRVNTSPLWLRLVISQASRSIIFFFAVIGVNANVIPPSLHAGHYFLSFILHSNTSLYIPYDTVSLFPPIFTTQPICFLTEVVPYRELTNESNVDTGKPPDHTAGVQ